MLPVRISKVPSPDGLVLRRDEVHVWRAELELPAHRVAHLRSLLDGDERERADRFAFDVHRRRFIVAHGLLRQLLGGYLREPPEAVRLRRAPRGKPYADERMSGALRFNLSHSGGRMLIAVTSGRELGVDLEQVRPGRDVMGIAGRFFSPAELKALRALPAGERVAAFYRCWTRKEAYMKATGEGLAMALDSFDVAFAPGVPAALLASARGAGEPRRWTLAGLAGGAGVEAALAVEGSGWRLVECTLADWGDAPSRPGYTGATQKHAPDPEGRSHVDGKEPRHHRACLQGVSER